MTKINPKFARRLLLSIGLDPDIFLREVRNSREAEFLITKTIQTKDKLYHPDRGLRQNPADFQKWAEIRDTIKHFSPGEIYVSLKLQKGGRRHHSIQRAVEEVQGQMLEKEKELVQKFGVGTYQRELLKNLTERYFVLTQLNRIYEHSNRITLDSLLVSQPFKGIFEEEMGRRRENKLSEESSKLGKKAEDLKEKINKLETQNNNLIESKKDILKLKQKLSKIDNYDEFYNKIKQYHDKSEDEIKNRGYSNKLEKFYEESEKLTEKRKIATQMFMKEEKKIKENYIPKISSFREKIGSLKLSYKLATLSAYIESYAEINKKVPNLEEKLDKIIAQSKDKEGDEKEGISLLINMIDLVDKMRGEIKKSKKDHFVRGQDYSNANEELLSDLPLDLIKTYILSRELIKRFTKKQDYLKAIREFNNGSVEINSGNFEENKKYLLRYLNNGLMNFQNYIKETNLDLNETKKKISEIQEQKRELNKFLEIEIPDTHLMDLFFKKGPRLFRSVYENESTKKSTLMPQSLVYIDNNLEIHYFNLYGTEKEIPFLSDFKSTKRKVVSILTSTSKIRNFLFLQRKNLYLPGVISKELEEPLSLSTIIDSKCYADFISVPEKGTAVLSVEESLNHGELFRIEGVISKSYQNLEKIIK